MTEREHQNAQNRERRLISAFMKAHCVGHDPKTRDSNGARQDKSVLANAATQGNCSKKHREAEPDLMDDRFAQQASSRGDETEQNGRRDAMNCAEAGKAHRETVEPTSRKWFGCHACWGV